MKTIIKNGYLINPKNKQEGLCHIFVDKGIIQKVMMLNQQDKEQTNQNQELLMYYEENARVIEAEGLHVTPGFIDLHTHLREPGQSEKETIKTGTEAAAKGGFTTVLCMPNTQPTLDDQASIQLLKAKLKEAVIEVFPIGAISKKIKGIEAADYANMLKEGIVGLSDDGKTTMDISIMNEALIFSKQNNLKVFTHCEDHHITENFSDTIYPKMAESQIVKRDIELANKANSPIHICHVSTHESIEIIRKQKSKNQLVTCEVCPHHLTLSEERLSKKGVMMNHPLVKVNPPIRSEKDRIELIKAIEDGIIDVIATDHAPHEMDTKRVPYEKASYGISGIEVAFQLAYQTLCKEASISFNHLISLLTNKPAEIANRNRGTIEEGKRADIVLIDLDKAWIIEPENFLSKGKNSPFKGYKGNGSVVMTMSKGEIVYVNR